MMITYQQRRKMNNQANRCFHLYAYLSVLMQMEMAYANKATTKAFLGVIANNVQELGSKLDKVLSKAVIFEEYGDFEEEYIERVSQLTETSELGTLKKINQQYSNIRGACGLIGIKLKTKYSVHDALAFANKV